jgi:hypothetical protein
MDQDVLQRLMDAEPTVRNHALTFLATQVVRARRERIDRETPEPGRPDRRLAT